MNFCDHCNRKFHTIKGVERHMNKEHGDNHDHVGRSIRKVRREYLGE